MKESVKDNLTRDKKNLHNEIELNSYEVQKVMGRIPSGIIRMGQGIILLVFICICIMCFFIKYPEYTTIYSEISNVNKMQSVRYSKPTIIDKIYKNDGDIVCKGDTICSMKDNSDVKYLISNNTGYIYITNEFREGRFVDSSKILYVIIDSLNKAPFSSFYVTSTQILYLKNGMYIESEWEHGIIRGLITEMSNRPDPQTGLFNVIVKWNQYNMNSYYPFYKRKIIIKLHMSDTQLWKVLLHYN